MSASEVAERNSARGVGEYCHVQVARDWRRVGHVPRGSHMDIGTQRLQTYAVLSLIYFLLFLHSIVITFVGLKTDKRVHVGYGF